MRLIDADALSELLVKTYETAPTEKALLFVALLLKNNEQVPTVEAFTKEDMAGAYNEGYACGSRENKRPQGEWIVKEGVVACYTACNKCGYANYNHKRPNFCPNCGSKMKN